MNFKRKKTDIIKNIGGLSPHEVLDKFIIETPKMNIPNKDKRCLLTFFLMIHGYRINKMDRLEFYQWLLEPHFQQNFTFIINRMILVFKHIEAYEMLDKMKKIIETIAKERHLRDLKFWDDIPIK